MRKLFVLLTILSVAMTSGCASITRGTKDAFAIESDPPGASVQMSNGLSCVTPCAMELPRKHGFTVNVSMEGYKEVNANVIPRQAGAGSAGMAGNVLLGGLIGAAVDAGSGAMKDLYPNPLVVKLVPDDAEGESQVQHSEIESAEEDAGGSDDPEDSTEDVQGKE